MTDLRAIRFFGILAVINGALLTIGIWTGVFSFTLFLLTIPISALCLLVIEKIGSFLGNSLAGWTPGGVNVRDQFAADLERARYSKREGRFDEALNIVNDVLHKEPDFPDAVYLKAIILYEGFGRAETGLGYLNRVMESTPKGETLHEWASNYHEKIVKGMKERQSPQSPSGNTEK